MGLPAVSVANSGAGPIASPRKVTASLASGVRSRQFSMVHVVDAMPLLWAQRLFDFPRQQSYGRPRSPGLF